VKHNLPDIQVKDNFFSKKEFNILVSNTQHIQLSARQNDDGNYGFRHNFKKPSNDDWFSKKIKDNFFPNLNLEFWEGGYHLRHNKEKPLVHIDPNSDYNFLCYLKGKELMYNGTGFYNDDKNLDRYIGFKENRALFFNSCIYHSDLQSLGESSPRYTLNIFYKRVVDN